MKAGLLRTSSGVAMAALLALTLSNGSHAIDRVDNAETIVTSPAAAAAAGAMEGCLEDGTGTGIDISYYVPAHNPGETMPMILHSHGWGGSKHNDPAAEIKENELFGSERGFLNRMVDNGYIVVSFSERGWGNSEGEVRGIDRSCETVDASAVLDWAIENLPVATVGDDDPVVGSFGGSYGGGFQHMLIQEDTRIDGIVAMGTWNSLPYSLVPNGILKRSFASLLCGLGQSASLDPVFAEGCAQAFLPVTRTQSQVTGTPGSVNFVNMLERNGIDYFDGPDNYFREYGYAGDVDAGVGLGSYRDAAAPIAPASAVPAMYVQGNRDVLFNMNEAIRNYRYITSQAGSDVWFLTNQSGHMNPLANQVNSSTNCGDIDIWEASEAFFL